MQISSKNIISGLFWRFAERCGAQIVSFIVQIILARLLFPEDYGLIGLVTVIIAIEQVFVDSGFGQALIQKKDADVLDFSSVFYFNIAFSVIIYTVMFFAAPYIGLFYNEPKLSSIVSVLSIQLIIGAFSGIQQAYVQKTMQFKKFFYATLSGVFVSAAVGIFLAFKGFGVWALVFQQLSNCLVNTVVLFFVVKWKPVLKFSINRIKSLFSFGWKLLCSAVLETTYNNIYSLIIGKFYSAKDLGYYNRGKHFPMLVIQNINSAIDSVLFPALSEIQEQRDRLKAMTSRAIKLSTFLIFPAMAGLAAIAKPLTILLLTEKWLPIVPYIQFCCFTYAFFPIHTANLQAIKALGRSDIFLKLEIVKKVIGITVLIVTLPFGLYIMMVGRCISAVLGALVNAYPNKKLLNYGYFEQIRDVLPSVIISAIMVVCISLINIFIDNAAILIVVQTLLGVIVYFSLAIIFKVECMEYILNILTNRKRKV